MTDRERKLLVATARAVRAMLQGEHVDGPHWQQRRRALLEEMRDSLLDVERDAALAATFAKRDAAAHG